MEIKTKFSIGEKIWTITDFKAEQIEVAMIIIKDGQIRYGTALFDTYREQECFATKEELLKYVAGE